MNITRKVHDSFQIGCVKLSRRRFYIEVHETRKYKTRKTPYDCQVYPETIIMSHCMRMHGYIRKSNLVLECSIPCSADGIRTLVHSYPCAFLVQ